MNTVDKGRRRQREARKKLESEGWLVYSAPRILYGPIDIWGLWDLICWKDGYIKLVQVKSTRCPADVRRRLRAFLTDGIFVRKEIWVYKNYSKLNPWIEKV